MSVNYDIAEMKNEIAKLYNVENVCMREMSKGIYYNIIKIVNVCHKKHRTELWDYIELLERNLISKSS